MPAEVLAPHEEGQQSQDEDRTLKLSVLEYCLVLEAGGEDPALGVDHEGLFQQADAEVQVPMEYGVEAVTDRRRLLSEHWKEKVEAPDEMDGAVLALMPHDAQNLKHWRVVEGEDGDEEADQEEEEEEEGVADDAQPLESGGGTQELLLQHALGLQHGPLHAADESFAAAQDVVQAQEEVAAVEQQQLESDGGSALAKNAHQLHGALKLAAGMVYQQGLDLVQRETRFAGVAEGLALLGKNFYENLSEVFRLEVMEEDESGMVILIVVTEALVKDSHAEQVCEE
uniref:Uncharacterized protein n=1 Tax=Sphaerodactylus townsendi TaxID=933632 RepID=A0ACB8FQJ2_9SAUR